MSTMLAGEAPAMAVADSRKASAIGALPMAFIFSTGTDIRYGTVKLRRHDHLGVAAVAAAAMPERGETDARVGAQAGQQRAQRFAHHLELRTLVGAEVAPHRAGAVDDDHGRRRRILGERLGGG